MTWGVVAIVGAAAVGGIATNVASKRAAEGQSKALQATQGAAEAARFDINRLFGQAGKERQGAFGRTLDFLSGAPSRQIEPFQAGSLAAQETTAAGLPQIQRAILGLPTDLSGIGPKIIEGDFDVDVSQFRPISTVSAPRTPLLEQRTTANPFGGPPRQPGDPGFLPSRQRLR